MRRFTNQRARARANGCTFQHALAGNRRGACAHGSPYGAAFTRGFTFVAIFEHGTRACANNGTANGGFQIFARGRANGSACYRASGGFIDGHSRGGKNEGADNQRCFNQFHNRSFVTAVG